MASQLPAALRVYRKLSSAIGPLTPVLAGRRLKQGKEDPARIDERRGIPRLARPAGPLVWIHGASVGEVLAAAALIERLRALNIGILLTSGTTTSAAVIARRFPSDIIHQYVPYDAPRFVARFLDHWQPSLALFIESDLWPNLLLSSAAQRVPMVLINGRMSLRSFVRWRKLSGTIAALLGRFDVCLAQSSIDAERFAALGSRNVITTGNLKLDVDAPPVDDGRLERLMTLTRGRPVVVAASTHPGEEEMLLHAHRTLAPHFPSLLTVIVPRHPNRGETIARMIAASGAQVALRSLEELPTARTDIYVADTMGELGLFYRLAPIVFMGGSLVPHGGQNPIEAVKLDAAIVHGPHVFNFAEVYEALDSAGGAHRSADGETLAEQLALLLNDSVARQSSVAAGKRVVEQLGGALERTLTALEPYLLQLRLERGPPMHEPAFWQRPSSPLSYALAPLAALYGRIAGRRMAQSGAVAGVPVICVGNYHVGGAGKTPTVLALAKLLGTMGETPVVLSRGYGGRLGGPAAVDPDQHTAADVGDEPLMMARSVPVIVARNRAAGLAPARTAAASVILMDDGFQNPAVVKDLSLIVIDSERGIGNGRVFPAGPLRAPLRQQVARTDAVVVIGAGKTADPVIAAVAARGGLIVRGHFKATTDSLARLGGRRALAFAGIGDPGRFFRTLQANGVDVALARAFSDHHPFTPGDIATLTADARRDGLTLVTTEKDLARLANRREFAELARDIVPFAVTLGWDDEASLRTFLNDRLHAARSSGAR